MLFRHSVLVLKADRVYREALVSITRRLLPRCQVMSASFFHEAEVLIRQTDVDTILAGSALPDGEIVDFIPRIPAARRPFVRVMVITQRKELHFLAMLNEFRVAGVFDSSTEGVAALEHALTKVVMRKQYWSPSIRELLGSACRANRNAATLTPTERLVLSAIGDGSDDRAAAERLGMHTAAIHSMRRNLHRKLQIQHRGELVQAAAQFGFVRFTTHGIARPGFEMLLQRSRE